jgi:hypothetical protein
MERTILSYLYSVSQKDEREKHSPLPDSYPFPHIDAGENGHGISEDRRRIDHGMRTYLAVVLGEWVKDIKDLCEGNVRLRYQEKASPWFHVRCRRYSWSDDDRACLAVSKKGTIVPVCEKGNISRARFFDGCNPGYLDPSVANHLSAN